MPIEHEGFYNKTSALETAASKVLGRPVRLHTGVAENTLYGSYQPDIVWQGESDTFALAARTFLHYFLTRMIAEQRERIEAEKTLYMRDNKHFEYYFEDCIDEMYARYLEENLRTLQAQFRDYFGNAHGATWHRGEADDFSDPRAVAMKPGRISLYAAILSRGAEAWEDEKVRRYYERQIEHFMVTVLNINIHQLTRIFYIDPCTHDRFSMTAHVHNQLACGGAVIGLYGMVEGLKEGCVFLSAEPYPGTNGHETDPCRGLRVGQKENASYI